MTEGASREKDRQSGGAADAGVALLLSCYALLLIIVNAKHEVAHLYGDVNVYLSQHEGVASLELNRLLPDALVPIASALLHMREQASRFHRM